MRRSVVTVLGLLAALSSLPAYAQTDGREMVGTYQLEQMGGLAVPSTSTEGAGQACPGGGSMVSYSITDGFVTLAIDGDAVLHAQAELACRMPGGSTRTQAMPQDMTGRWLPKGPGRVRVLAGRTTLDFAFDATQRTLANRDMGALWRDPARRVVSDTAVSAQVELAVADPSESPAAVQEGNYDCRKDPVLKRAGPIPAADTAGLGTRITRAAPGYRLATEEEIACAAVANKAETLPEAPWGTGFWWSWNADFDVDGRGDRALLIHPIRKPVAEDEAGEPAGRILVLFANGRSATIPSAVVFEIVPKGKHLTACSEGDITLPSPGLLTDLYFGNVFYWSKGEFEEFYGGC